MSKIAHNRTVLIIAHRLSTVRTADKIITMENGCVIEEGSHDELLKPADVMHNCIVIRPEGEMLSKMYSMPDMRRIQ